MKSASFKPGSGRVIVALLGLVFLKALGEMAGIAPTSRGRSAEAISEPQDADLPVRVAPEAHESLSSDADDTKPAR